MTTTELTPAAKAWATRRANGDTGSAAGRKAWETRQAKAGSAPLALGQITKGLSVRWKFPGTKDGEGFRVATVERRLNANTFRLKVAHGQGFDAATAKVGELFAA